MCSGQGGVLVAPALAEMDGEALAALFEEHFDHALAEARVDLAADIAVGHRVVVAFDAHMAVRPDLAVDPLAPLPGVRRQGLERRPLVRLEQCAAALAACHGGVVEPVELAADRGVHRVQREEGLMAQRQQDARLDRADRRFDQPLADCSQMQAVALGRVMLVTL